MLTVVSKPVPRPLVVLGKFLGVTGAIAMAYWLLAGFLVPPSFASRLLGIDLWRLYFLSLAVLPGTLILLGLVLWQYLTIPLQEERSQG